MQTKLRRRNYNEVLFSNRIDNEFNRMLFPLNILQQITFGQKYRIRDKFITSNNNITHLIAFCIVICFVVYIWYQHLTMDFVGTLSSATAIADFVIELIFEPIVLLINFAYTVRYANTHVTLFLKLQRLAKFTKYSEYKCFTVINWFAIIWFVIYYASHVLLMYVKYNIFLWSVIIQFIINSYIFYTSRFVHLLRRNLVLWTDNIIELEGSIRTKTEEETKRIHQSEVCGELFNYFKDILEAFSILKKTFEFMVLGNLMDMFFRGLIHLQYLIEMTSMKKVNEMETTLFTTLFLLWTVRSLAVQILISVECEKFYLALEDAACACLILRRRRTSVDLCMLCKNAGRLRRAAFTKMDVLGFGVIDAKLSLTMISTYSTYIIVLLQFAYL